MRRRRELPPPAAEFEERATYDKKKIRHLLGRFHEWLTSESVSISEIHADHVEQFLGQGQLRNLAPSTKSLYQHRLHRYLRWLAERNYIDADACKTKRTKPLPESARRFIQQLQPILRPRSCEGCRHALGRFFRWADSAGVDVHDLTRSNILEFSQFLHHQGLAASTRCGYLHSLRNYLRYLHEQELLKTSPKVLLRSDDFPRLPDCLPRALSPRVDVQLCGRLADSTDPRCLSLLVMRKTGLRVGELRMLPFDCVQNDHSGNHYIKVPLGKLNNERLVPIDDETYGLIERIKLRDQQPRKWLLPNPRTGQPFHYNSYRKSLRIVARDLANGGKEITTHQLRHSYASSLLNAGMSLASIRQLLGHKSINMTMRYAMMSPTNLRKEFLEATSKTQTHYSTLPMNPIGIEDSSNKASCMVAELALSVRRDAATLAPHLRAQGRRIARRLQQIGDQLGGLGL